MRPTHLHILRRTSPRKIRITHHRITDIHFILRAPVRRRSRGASLHISVALRNPSRPPRTRSARTTRRRPHIKRQQVVLPSIVLQELVPWTCPHLLHRPQRRPCFVRARLHPLQIPAALSQVIKRPCKISRAQHFHNRL